jgi:hypothetical protein
MSVSSLAVFCKPEYPGFLHSLALQNKNARRVAGHLIYQLAPRLTDDLFIN